MGVPPEGIAIILGVDRILDMARTVPNVVGDLTAAVFLAHSEASRAAVAGDSQPSGH
ncbi:MAG: cation:dicarboxylate symporter family transporter [Chromatocurvus sp.]